PDQADDREDGEALGDRRDEVFPPDEPAVEETQSGRHDHDEGRGRDDPRDVSGVERQVPLSAETDFGRQSDTAYNASRPSHRALVNASSAGPGPGRRFTRTARSRSRSDPRCTP